jgi:MFS family permease
MPRVRSSESADDLLVIAVVAFTFVAYLSIGLPLSVLPIYVQRTFGVNVILAGLIVSVQYVATFASRPWAGSLCDRRGPKPVVVFGLGACAVSGLLTAIATLLPHLPSLSLGTLAAGRLALGIGESMVSTGAIMWGIGRIGAAQTARVISWNGVATYSALALGAPVGAFLEAHFGFIAVGLCVLAMSLAATLVALGRPSVTTPHPEPVPIRAILSGVWPFGLTLAIGGMGFGVIATFITLYFAHQNWLGASISLSLYGFFFVGTRLLFNRTITRFGGFPVALISFAVEAAGLALLAVPNRSVAFLASALVGMGFSLVFPALGVEAANAFPASVRGSVLGIYTSFVDFSLFAAGPLAGAGIHAFGFGTVFLLTAFAIVLAFAGTLRLQSLQAVRPDAADPSSNLNTPPVR